MKTKKLYQHDHQLYTCIKSVDLLCHLAMQLLDMHVVGQSLNQTLRTLSTSMALYIAIKGGHVMI